jgi:putative salt-induced outer membrane protein
MPCVLYLKILKTVKENSMLKVNLALMLAILSTVASAEEKRPWEVEVELGAIATSGNTETTSVHAKVDAKQNLARFNNEYIFNSLYKQDDVPQDNNTKVKAKTAEKYLISAKSSYQLSTANRSYLFGIASYANDKFGAYRVYETAAIGYGDWLYETDKVNWFLEAGPGYFRGEKVLPTLSVNDPYMFEIEQGPFLRVATELEWKVTQTAIFKQTFSVESGSDNTRSVSETSLAASISNAMQMKIGCTIASDTKVAPGKKKTDTTTSATIVYKF